MFRVDGPLSALPSPIGDLLVCVRSPARGGYAIGPGGEVGGDEAGRAAPGRAARSRRPAASDRHLKPSRVRPSTPSWTTAPGGGGLRVLAGTVLTATGWERATVPDLLALSSKDHRFRRLVRPPNRIADELSEVGRRPGGDRVVRPCVDGRGDRRQPRLLDASGPHTGATVVGSPRGWQTTTSTPSFAHGHVDHRRAGAMLAKAPIVADTGVPTSSPTRAVTARFEIVVDARPWTSPSTPAQFGGVIRSPGSTSATARTTSSRRCRRPTRRTSERPRCGSATWRCQLAPCPRRADDHMDLAPGTGGRSSAATFSYSMFPDAGDPQKVQRHAGECSVTKRIIGTSFRFLFRFQNALPLTIIIVWLALVSFKVSGL